MYVVNCVFGVDQEVFQLRLGPIFSLCTTDRSEYRFPFTIQGFWDSHSFLPNDLIYIFEYTVVFRTSIYLAHMSRIMQPIFCCS